MQMPMDAVFDGFGFDEKGEWHRGSLLDVWGWGFSNLADGEVKGSVAGLIVKLLLRVEPETMTAEEVQLLRMNHLFRDPLMRGAEPEFQYDA